MSLFSFKKKSNLSLVFDIKDSSISVAAVKFEKGSKPEMVLCQNLKIEGKVNSNHDKYLASMLKTLDDAVISIRRALVNIGNKENIGKHYFFVGSPWSISESKMIKILKDKPFKIDKHLVGKVITTEEDTEIKAIERDSDMSDWKLLEEKIIQTKLNGYPSDSVLGKKTKDLEIDLFTSFIPRKIKDKILMFENDIFGKFRAGRLNSCVMSPYSFLRDLFSDKNDFVCIDVGDYITDAFVVRGDAIQATVSVPMGKKEIIRFAATKTQTPPDIVLSALHITHGGTNIVPHEKINKIARDGIKSWIKKVDDAVSSVCADINIPKNIFFLVNDNLAHILIKEVKDNIPSGKFKVFGEGVDISHIDENAVDGSLKNGKAFKNEPHIKMDLVFLDKIIF